MNYPRLWPELTFLLVSLCYSSTFAEHVQIRTNDGILKGNVVSSFNGNRVREFLGIPFAEPPFGHLKFRHPIRNKGWRGVYDATYRRDACDQLSDGTYPGFAGSEIWNSENRSADCLYVNLWTPLDNAYKLPVLVWIFGGGFYSGSNNLEVYDGVHLAGNENVVLVAINYRVASYGFLYFGVPEAPGNAGLFDQLMALSWIQENIGVFGGDRNRVTLFGESAGAASCGLHLLSPLSYGKMHRVIFQSGSPTSPWATQTQDEGFRRSKKLAEFVDCWVEGDLPAVVDCMVEVPTSELLQYEYMVQNWEFEQNFINGLLPFIFIPVIDGNFIIDEPDVLLREGRFSHNKIMVGGNMNEGSFWLIYYLSAYYSKDDQSLLTRSAFLDSIYNYTNRALKEPSKDAIAFAYSNWKDMYDRESNRKAIDDIVGDYCFMCPAVQFANYFTRFSGKAWAYYLDYRAESEVFHDWMGVIHGADIQWTFGNPLYLSRGAQLDFTDKERDLARRVMHYWANFARSGNPNQYDENDKHFEVTWPQYKENDRRYIHLNLEDPPRQSVGLKSDKCGLWEEYIPAIENRYSTCNVIVNSGVTWTSPTLLARSVIILYVILSFAFQLPI